MAIYGISSGCDVKNRDRIFTKSFDFYKNTRKKITIINIALEKHNMDIASRHQFPNQTEKEVQRTYEYIKIKILGETLTRLHSHCMQCNLDFGTTTIL